MGCLICERIEQIKRGENPYFVCELSTGYVVLGDHQRFCGYTLFLSKQHVTELYHLPWEFRTRFLQEMSLVAEAVAAIRQNYMALYGVEELSEQLGVTKSHLVRAFKQEIGVPPGKYLTNVRIEAVRRLGYRLEVAEG